MYHHRTVDTLGKMLRAGTIDQAMHDAAKDFQAGQKETSTALTKELASFAVRIAGAAA